MTPKFSIGQILFNGNTKEIGTVGRVYESNGITMYEVRIPVDPQWHSAGCHVSDWAEDVLEIEQGHSPVAGQRKTTTA
jgi:hypothetical protein